MTPPWSRGMRRAVDTAPGRAARRRRLGPPARGDARRSVASDAPREARAGDRRADPGQHAIGRTQPERHAVVAQESTDRTGRALRVFHHERPHALAHRLRHPRPANRLSRAHHRIRPDADRLFPRDAPDRPHRDAKLGRNCARRELRAQQRLDCMSIQHSEHPPLASSDGDCTSHRGSMNETGRPSGGRQNLEKMVTSFRERTGHHQDTVSRSSERRLAGLSNPQVKSHTLLTNTRLGAAALVTGVAFRQRFPPASSSTGGDAAGLATPSGGCAEHFLPMAHAGANMKTQDGLRPTVLPP
ncbi:hypothetical protein BH11GEM2_BH11GEM2_40030 [soil metagenome]